MTDKPIITVVAGPRSAGKTLVMRELRQEAEFPARLVVEHEEEKPGAALQALAEAITMRRSAVIETRLQSPEVLHLMQKAADRGVDVDLLVVNVDDAEILRERLKREGLDDAELLAEMDRFHHHLPAAVDQAKRVLLIDNSAGVPIAVQLAAAAQLEATTGREPGWIVNRVIRPKVERELSREVLRTAIDRTSDAAPQLKPLLQIVKTYGTSSYRGQIIERTDHHALQRIGQVLHAVHDLAMLPHGGGIGLAKNLVANISYQLEKAPTFARETAKTVEKGMTR